MPTVPFLQCYLFVSPCMRQDGRFGYRVAEEFLNVDGGDVEETEEWSRSWEP